VFFHLNKKNLYSLVWAFFPSTAYFFPDIFALTSSFSERQSEKTKTEEKIPM